MLERSLLQFNTWVSVYLITNNRNFFYCLIISLLFLTERVAVTGEDQIVFARVGEDVVLNCMVDSHIPPQRFDEVSWKTSFLCCFSKMGRYFQDRLTSVTETEQSSSEKKFPKATSQ